MFSKKSNLIKKKRKFDIVEIEDVSEAFCGCRRRYLQNLVDAHPEIAEDWCYKRNAGWGPEDFSRASGVRCWWICRDCNREYKAQIFNRTVGHSGCPYCDGKRVCSDNALSERDPELAKEWHPTKNKLRTDQVTVASSKRAWWLCSNCAHEWETNISDRSTLGSGCPACYEAWIEDRRENPQTTPHVQIVLSKDTTKVSRKWYEDGTREFVSLSKACPKVAKQWHSEKNGKLTPKDFAKGSDAIAWWKCNKGVDHEWQAAIYTRTGDKKSGCPFCAGKNVSITNSLESKFPELAKEWHPTLNGLLKPDAVTAGSGKRVWWKCKKNSAHEWQTSISNRTKSNANGCPYCSRFLVSEANSLQINFPYIAAQLHPDLNGGKKGAQIASMSATKYWWICHKGPDHVWQATPSNRVGRGSNCPYCAGLRVSVTNSLETLFPFVAEQWDIQKNGGLKPSEISATSTRKVWWRCVSGHSWEQQVNKKSRMKGACYECKTGKPGPGRITRGKFGDTSV